MFHPWLIYLPEFTFCAANEDIDGLFYETAPTLEFRLQPVAAAVSIPKFTVSVMRNQDVRPILYAKEPGCLRDRTVIQLAPLRARIGS